ncbi:MAG: glycosyltransferase family 4 protein [Deltaproteobacteria bacterium]|nr:glycosyltransferase family 4 protein [Deltaproteobacteria bacterium]
MNILLISDSYPPEIRSASHLMRELAEELLARGHGVAVATSYPRYNLAEGLEHKAFSECSVEDGVKVIRVKTPPHHKVNFIIRGISQLIMPHLFFSRIARHIKSKVDVVIVYSPPLPLAAVGQKVKKRYGARFILNVQDIFPQNAKDLGILRNRAAISLFERLERKAYAGADVIAVHSDGNKRFLIEKKNLPPGKVSTVHNWISIEPYMNARATGSFRKGWGVEGKFIFLFAGVVGPSQGLDMIIRAANELREIKDICFLIVGDGTEKDRLEKLARSYSLDNVYFRPFVSKEEYPALVKESDVGLVCLSSMNRTPVVPGKILGYMAASLPIAAFLNRESDGHELIREAGCGYSEVSEDHGKIAEVLLRMYRERDRLKGYGENGLSFVSAKLEKSVCIDKLEKIFHAPEGDHGQRIS